MTRSLWPSDARGWIVFSVGLSLLTGSALPAADRFAVHEWGTFTCLQDETGRAIAGVNTDDEPLPKFVHRLADFLIFPPSELPLIYYKGIPMLHPHVTMRLETPVIYFYPPAGQTKPLELDAQVQFRGGWLSEYYPNANSHAPGINQDGFRFGPITSKTNGSLEWRRLQVGGDAAGPETDYHVWLAPREVKAASVTTPDGEAERYLFYRGVGHVEAPLRVYRDKAEGKLVVNERFGPEVLGRDSSGAAVTTLWLADIRQGGEVAFREIPKVRLKGDMDRTIATFAAEFRPEDYSKDNLVELRGAMKAALLADGLFADEAEAMLNTWEYGYFKSPGLRLFFLLPRAWTDAVLPLELSPDADVVRTMVGRIELVTPEHRRLLDRIAQAPLSSLDWYDNLHRRVSGDAEVYRQLWEGRARFADLGLAPPAEYRDYLALGRFRNALVLDAIAQKSNPGLEKFAAAYRLQYYDPNE
jgi:hypothetical protein